MATSTSYTHFTALSSGRYYNYPDYDELVRQLKEDNSKKVYCDASLTYEIVTMKGEPDPYPLTEIISCSREEVTAPELLKLVECAAPKRGNPSSFEEVRECWKKV